MTEKAGKSTRPATILVTLYCLLSVGGLVFIRLNWARGPMAEMANGILVSMGAAVMFVLAVTLMAIFFFATAGIRHYLAIIGMICVWLAMLVPFYQHTPRVDYAIKFQNNSTGTITVDTLTTFGQPVTSNGFWTLRQGDTKEYGCLASTRFPRALTLIWWHGRAKPDDAVSIIQTHVDCPEGLENVGTLVFTIDSNDDWAVAVENLYYVP